MFIPGVDRICMNASVRRHMLVHDVVYSNKHIRVRALRRFGWLVDGAWTGEGKRIVSAAFAEYDVRVYVDAVGGTGSSYLIFAA